MPLPNQRRSSRGNEPIRPWTGRVRVESKGRALSREAKDERQRSPTGGRPPRCIYDIYPFLKEREREREQVVLSLWKISKEHIDTFSASKFDIKFLSTSQLCFFALPSFLLLLLFFFFFLLLSRCVIHRRKMKRVSFSTSTTRSENLLVTRSLFVKEI